MICAMLLLNGGSQTIDRIEDALLSHAPLEMKYSTTVVGNGH